MCRPSSTATLAPRRAASSATREAGKPGPDHADIDIEVERQTASETGASSSGPLVALVKVSAMAFSYGPLRRLSPCPGHELVD